MPLGTVWSNEEDLRLGELVKLHGPKKWSQIAADLNSNKGSKQCRRRWKNFLSLDDRKLGSWTAEEDAQLLECHKQHGNKWTLIAQEIGGRTDNAVKNRWAALEKRRKESDGYGQQRTYSRDSSDLLAVRRIISKDQPQCSYGGRQHSNLMDASWMQDSFNQSAAAAALQQQQQQLDQGAYTMQPAFGGRQPGCVTSSMPMGKPDLKINIPGATAPELPYSQRPQAAGADPSRLHKVGGDTPREMWLDPHDQGKVEDALLSTSRQGAHAPMAGLQTPAGDTIADLCNFLYSGTPGANRLCAAAATAAAGQPGPAAPWREPIASMVAPPQQQQQYLQQEQLLPASSAPYMGQQQQQQQQQLMYMPPGHMSVPQDAGAGYMQMQQPGRVVPPQGMNYSQPQLQQQPVHALSKLSRTVSGFDGPVHPVSMPQPSLPDGMLLRQAPPPPQPRFVPQGPLPQSQGFVAMGGSMMTHSNTAVTTAAGGFQPAARPMEHMQMPMAGLEQEQHMMHRHQMPVLSQQQPPVSHLLPQDPMLPPQSMQPQHMMRPQHADMPDPQRPGFAPPSQLSSHWDADGFRQLMACVDGFLHPDGTRPVVQQQVLAHPPPLQTSGSCLTAPRPVADECKLEQANNVTGSLTAAT